MASPKATTGAIIERDGKILLTKRNHEPFKGKWCCPGGHIEPNETAGDAIVREVKEETGLSFKPEFFGYFNEIIPEINWHAVQLTFTGPTEGDVVPNEEVSEWKWLPPEEALKEDLAFENSEIIKQWIERRSK